MVELRTLHFTDIEDDFYKYDAMLDFVRDSEKSGREVDAVLFTGDMIHAHMTQGKTIGKIAERLQILQSGKIAIDQEDSRKINDFQEKHNIQKEEDLQSLDEEKKKEYALLENEIIEKSLLQPVFESYQTHGEKIKSFNLPVYAVLGNHDLTAGYEIIGDKINFLDQKDKAVIKGKTGLEFILKGDNNTMERPRFYIDHEDLFKKYFIPYISGYSLSVLRKSENELQNKIPDYANERLEKLSKNEEPEHSEEDLKKLQQQLEQTIEQRKKVLEFYASEKERLQDDNVDIYLTHRLPYCKKARNDIQDHLSDLTAEYSAKAKSVHGGHFHDGQIGNQRLADLVNLLKNDSSLEKEVIDDQKVPVFYLDGNKPWQINPGVNHFLITEYNADKEVEQVLIYEY